MREVFISGGGVSKAAMEPSFGGWGSLRGQVSAEAIIEVFVLFEGCVCVFRSLMSQL